MSKKELLEDILNPMENDSSLGLWQGKISIQRVHASHIKTGWQSEGYSVYSQLLILSGNLSVEYNKKNIELHAGDLYFYAPGMPSRMLGMTDDYDAYLFMLDEKTVINHPMLSLFLKSAYAPVSEYNYPKITLTKPQIEMMTSLYEVLYKQIHLQMANLSDVLFRICEVISINVVNFLQQNIEKRKVTTRMEDTFSQFLQLVPTHAVKHHDIAFYADRLNISTTYLSRIVRLISGRTVMSFLEYAITNEAVLLLKNSKQSITDIAFALNFSDQSSFTRFFIRQKGISPLQFRKRLVT